jgi:hypothetical protein
LKFPVLALIDARHRSSANDSLIKSRALVNRSAAFSMTASPRRYFTIPTLGSLAPKLRKDYQQAARAMRRKP